MDSTKYCNKCNSTKLVQEFYSNKSTKDGKQQYCKECWKHHYYTARFSTVQAWSKAYFQKNKERKQEYSKLYKRANRDKASRYARNAYAKDPQKALSYCHNRRTRMSGSSVTKQEWDSRLEEFNNCCAYCLQPSDSLEMDHVQALSTGGQHSIDNLVPACRSCNSKKHNKSLVQFVQSGALHLY